MKYLSKKVIVAAIPILLISCGQSEADKKLEKKEYHNCVNRGVAYFKEIGSYPNLKAKSSKNKSALVEAQERCKREPKTAF